uniref:Ubiquinol-cytochrome-c reductase complex assembly factor 2 n=1 Tax=Parastrongyloides trichosuri TaxID=131310 RepID=A0A0N4Z965_PARTI
MKQLYKSYISLISKWPKDVNKSGKRCFPTFLQNTVKKTFEDGKLGDVKIDESLCRRRLRALEDIRENRFLQSYPHTFKSGIFGLKIDYLEVVNNDNFRKKIGLEKKPSLWQRITRRNNVDL